MLKSRIKFRKNGFTLLETMIYSLLVGVVLTSFVYFAIGLSASKEKYSAILEASSSSRDAMDVISRELRKANALIGVEGGALSFYDENGNVKSLDAGEKRFKISSSEGVQYLTGKNQEIENLSFVILGEGAQSVKIFFTLKAGGGNNQYSRDYQTTVALRKR